MGYSFAMPSRLRGFAQRLCLAVFVGFAVFCLTACTVPAWGAAWDGSTKTKPTWDATNGRYVIETAEELAFLAEAVNDGSRDTDTDGSGLEYAKASYFLAADIDLSGCDWTPIGTDTDKAFQGTFYGDGHAVSGMEIVSVSYSYRYAGLFGVVRNNATIRGLGVTNFMINVTNGSDISAGGLAGLVWENSEITSCYATGAVTSSSSSSFFSSSFAGGLAGEVSYSTVTSCYATGAVTSSSSSSFAGGLAGRVSYSTVTSCYATGAVTSSSSFSFAGGLAGEVLGNTSSISICYAWGSVEVGMGNNGTLYHGGLIGRVHSDVDSGKITSSDWRCGAGVNEGMKGIGEDSSGVGDATDKIDQEIHVRSLDIAGFGAQSNFEDQGWDFGAGAPNYTSGDWCYVEDDKGARPHLRVFYGDTLVAPTTSGGTSGGCATGALPAAVIAAIAFKLFGARRRTGKKRG